MPILATTTPAPAGTPLPGAVAPAPNVELKTFQFVAGWILLITLLVFANKTRLGHVILYYVLALLIIFILVTEYAQILPYLNFQTPGELQNAS